MKVFRIIFADNKCITVLKENSIEIHFSRCTIYCFDNFTA
jgi:hypothetical protein